MCPLAPRPPGAGRVGRAEAGPSWSALTARGLCGQSPRPVFAGCHMSRGTPAPGSPGRPLQPFDKLRVQASGLHPSPDSRHGSCGATSAPAPPGRAPRLHRRRRGHGRRGRIRPGGWKPALRPVAVENDALRCPVRASNESALVLTPGETPPAPRWQASRREDPARCLRGAAPAVRRRRSAFSFSRPDEEGAAKEKCYGPEVWTPAGLALTRG